MMIRICRLFILLIVFHAAGHAQDGVAVQPNDTCMLVMHQIGRGLFRSVPVGSGYDSAFQHLRTLTGFNQKMDVAINPEGFRSLRFIAQQAWIDTVLLLDDKSYLGLHYTTDSLGKKHIHHVEANYSFRHQHESAAVFAHILKTLNDLKLPFIYKTSIKQEKYREYNLGCNHFLTVRYGTDINNEFSSIALNVYRNNP